MDPKRDSECHSWATSFPQEQAVVSPMPDYLTQETAHPSTLAFQSSVLREEWCKLTVSLGEVSCSSQPAVLKKQKHFSSVATGTSAPFPRRDWQPGSNRGLTWRLSSGTIEGNYIISHSHRNLLRSLLWLVQQWLKRFFLHRNNFHTWMTVYTLAPTYDITPHSLTSPCNSNSQDSNLKQKGGPAFITAL